MVINNPNICYVVFPSKEYSPLVLDANAIETQQVTFHVFKAFAWQETQIFQLVCRIQNIQFT